MDGLMIALVVAALVIGGLLMLFIQLTSRRQQTLNVEMYQKVWQVIERSMQSGQAMRESGVKGTTMGERLKARKGMWTNENAVWAAHKLRNQIAHDDHVALDAQTAKRAMAGFEQALKDLGAL
jgi:hypothetical protein